MTTLIKMQMEEVIIIKSNVRFSNGLRNPCLLAGVSVVRQTQRLRAGQHMRFFLSLFCSTAQCHVNPAHHCTVFWLISTSLDLKSSQTDCDRRCCVYYCSTVRRFGKLRERCTQKTVTKRQLSLVPTATSPSTTKHWRTRTRSFLPRPLHLKM
jgi:hypothetical protein